MVNFGELFRRKDLPHPERAKSFLHALTTQRTNLMRKHGLTFLDAFDRSDWESLLTRLDIKRAVRDKDLNLLQEANVQAFRLIRQNAAMSVIEVQMHGTESSIAYGIDHVNKFAVNANLTYLVPVEVRDSEERSGEKEYISWYIFADLVE